ncbi:MAG: hypothetical protein AUJ28_00480 [Parcubacteria group bacterium CG1_02_37_51]|uniref:Type 4 fimbrial biogenesis protein PilX N-terminal domain-containing protein n=2 Tax=Candidatus Komeiliibacteriota TaxID=1817908 RepID=A0A2M8DS89_9BACT|nr:MAG: hypothetical protein AUJ28_00480 [Parcubacteria group bacterium CG1_02_37_51]PIY95252.1 MAG: hypothetical protein COY67_00920 [Candidatus Komeilibacteria bacterium CG_4_10_14_0_8_um_filter_37_78]PJC02255.1 MAG: hypothetical protein CO073_00440 [Candidatus Komeilibacteria bacterium CG_4_9_14_0_8_um_filter_36_9]
MHVKEKLQNNNQGTILLIAVMIMATILAAAMGTGTLVINIINQSASIDYSIAAFYAAEAGIEKNLYRIRQTDYPGEIALKQYGIDAPTTDSLDLTAGQTLQSHYDLSTINGQDEIVVDLYENIEYQLNMYDPNQEQEPLAIGRLDIINDGSNTEDITLHISWVSWSATGQLQTPQAQIETIVAGDVEEHHITLSSSALYKVRLRTLDGDLTNVTIKAYDQAVDPTPQAIPGEYVLRSTGEYPTGKSKYASQVMTVRMPIIVPTYGLYNFVIFSEGDIAKSVTW